MIVIIIGKEIFGIFYICFEIRYRVHGSIRIIQSQIRILTIFKYQDQFCIIAGRERFDKLRCKFPAHEFISLFQIIDSCFVGKDNCYGTHFIFTILHKSDIGTVSHKSMGDAASP